ncbi:unnamed protein product [Blepharisma stoltei]|uniref:Uncharacterized protein n=1 Tax=Blepharisma stoltei TaxID=1481888 RepID=A0AAU9J0Q7_9CILI|nr:unnamed protein product [Blepharisma stoltei]
MAEIPKTSSQISKLDIPGMSKLRKQLAKIPIEVPDISLKLDHYKKSLDFKSEFLNSHILNSSFSPELIERDKIYTSKAIELQQVIGVEIGKKFRQRYIEELLKHDSEVRDVLSNFDSWELKNTYRRMNRNKLKSKFEVENFRYKTQRLSVDVLRKKAKSEIQKNEREILIKRNDWKENEFVRRNKISEMRDKETSFLTQMESL